METTDQITCGCGCGFRLGPGMYGFNVRGTWFAQGCVGRLRPYEAHPADDFPARPAPTDRAA